jgi:hypothetical protein
LVDDSKDPKEAILSVLLETSRQKLSTLRSPRAADTAAEVELERISQELASMNLWALKQKALREHGIAKATVEGVDDADDPKGELLAILLDVLETQLLLTRAQSAKVAFELKRLEAQLAPRTLRALKQHALADGMAAVAVDAVDDCDAPKEALLALLLESARACFVEQPAPSAPAPPARTAEKKVTAAAVQQPMKAASKTVVSQKAPKKTFSKKMRPLGKLRMLSEDYAQPSVSATTSWMMYDGTPPTSIDEEDSTGGFLASSSEPAARQPSPQRPMSPTSQLQTDLASGTLSLADVRSPRKSASTADPWAARQHSTGARTAAALPGGAAADQGHQNAGIGNPLEAELRTQKLSALQKRAEAAGITEGTMSP